MTKTDGGGEAAPGQRIRKRSVKLYSIDALRGFLLANVVLLHAATSFAVHTPQGWAASDRSRVFLLHPWEVYVFDLWAVLIVAALVPTFFLLAGLYGMVLIRRSRVRGFIRNRMRLIVAPFLASLAVITPLTLLVGLFGQSWNAAPGTPRSDFWAFAGEFFGSGQFLLYIEPYHLWFLYYLILAYALFVLTIPIWDPLFRSERFRSRARQILSSRLRAPVLAVFTFIPMLLMHMAIDTPSGFVPSLGILLFYWVFFMVGALLARQPSLIPLFWARWRGALAFGMFVVLPLTALLGAFSFLSGTGSDALMRNLQLPSALENLVRPMVDGGALSKAVARAAPVLVKYGYAMYGWMLVFGIMGAFQHFFTRPSKTVRFIAESSYWIYLIHFPLVLLLQVLVQDLQVPAIIKYCLLCATVLALLMGSFQLFVRNTWLGAALGGPAAKRRMSRPSTA